MNYTSKLTTSMAKIIGSIMTVAFSLVAFAYGQNCNLLPGWSPSTLTDGQSRTGYQIDEATFTQSCTGSLGLITCISGSVANGNTYVYPSCIPHTWANCTTPTGANHLEYRTLYKANHNTYTQTCQQLSQSLQCLDNHFTGGTTPGLYTFASCIDQPRAQCINTRTTPASFKDHGEIVIGYSANHPGIGQTCNMLRKTLTCTNSFWSGNGTAGQAGLVTGCINPPVFSGCLNIWTNTMIPHGSTINAYTSSSGNCTNLLQPLTCTNGAWLGNGVNQQAGLFSGCTQVGLNSCANIMTYSGTVPHGTVITKYTHPTASLPHYCNEYAISLQCVNSVRSGLIGGLSTGCQNIASGSCINLLGQYTSHLGFMFVYNSPAPTTGFGCDSVKIPVYCNAGIRHTGSALGTVIGPTLSASYYSNCGGCILPRGATLAEGTSIGAYSFTGVDFPKNCASFHTTLSCGSGGILNGNYQTYKFPGCITSGGLVSGVDLTINESPGLQGYENISGFLIAQGSSPQISILFKNRGDMTAGGLNLPAGFLKCQRVEPNINIYSSNILQEFIVAPGTKVGTNIRIKSIFTQALGAKTLECTVNAAMAGETNPSYAGNNTWSGTFEVVKADRFDLALSRSIETISKNLEAAEGAKGTQGLQNFLYDKIMNVLVPLIVIIGILSAILGFYKLMFSNDENAIKEGTRYIVFGVIGIIFIMSAKFIGQNIFDILWNAPNGEIKGYEIASGLYERILYPFIKFAIYLVLGAMFVILVSRVITFLFGSDADAQKKAGTLIGWNIISMLIIIGAKQIVEAIYGKQGDVVKDITNLGEIGSGVLADKNIPILYQVINYALGMASLIILVIIIIQTVKLLMKPDDPAQIKNIKNSLLYMFIGILVLGTGYLIVNFAIIN